MPETNVANPACRHRAACRLCASPDLTPVLPLTPTPVGDDYVTRDRLAEAQPVYPLTVSLCRACGHVQLQDVVDPEILYGNFIYTTSISLGLNEHFQRYAAEVVARFALPPGALAADIGSNDGTLLRCFQAHGLRALGVEPAREIARQASAAGVETLPLFFSAELGRQLRAERGPAALITVNNTFANVDQLDDMTAGIRAWLAPDGVLVMETGYALDLAQSGLWDTIYHEHLGYFSVKPLQQFLARHELELIDAQRIPTKGGSLRAVAQLAGGPRPVAASVQQLLDLEAAAGLDQPAAFQPLADRIAALQRDLAALLTNLRAQGKTVAGYGASVGSTTVLYHLGLGQALRFIADENPAKHGRYSPGDHLPVLPAAALLEQRPDYVVILAWRYAQPILDKNRAYREQGGRFIVPWPELVIV